jgi:hypothetical protein
MLEINLQAIPNQTFSITLDSNNYDIEINAATGCVGMSIVRNNIEVVTGMRVVAGFPVIPYQYLEDGNFVFTTANDDLPDWEQFGITQTLVYVSAAELAAIRAGT